MNQLPAILAAAAGLATALAGLVAVLRHINGPAHQPPSSGPGGPSSAGPGPTSP